MNNTSENKKSLLASFPAKGIGPALPLHKSVYEGMYEE